MVFRRLVLTLGYAVALAPIAFLVGLSPLGLVFPPAFLALASPFVWQEWIIARIMPLSVASLGLLGIGKVVGLLEPERTYAVEIGCVGSAAVLVFLLSTSDRNPVVTFLLVIDGFWAATVSAALHHHLIRRHFCL